MVEARQILFYQLYNNMAHTRTYTPIYTDSKEDYENMVNRQLETEDHYLIENPKPYDWRVSNWWEVEKRDNIHFTLFYRDDIKQKRLWKMYLFWKKLWFSMYEAGDDDKSIDIPHIHLIKKKTPL
jgi:hypothetical protein